MDKTLRDAIARGIEARRNDPGYYDREAEKRTRTRDNSRDPVRTDITATSVPWRRRANPSPAKTDREKRARLPVAQSPQQEVGHWETFDAVTGKYLGSLQKVSQDA